MKPMEFYLYFIFKNAIYIDGVWNLNDTLATPKVKGYLLFRGAGPTAISRGP